MPRTKDCRILNKDKLPFFVFGFLDVTGCCSTASTLSASPFVRIAGRGLTNFELRADACTLPIAVDRRLFDIYNQMRVTLSRAIRQSDRRHFSHAYILVTIEYRRSQREWKHRNRMPHLGRLRIHTPAHTLPPWRSHGEWRYRNRISQLGRVHTHTLTNTNAGITNCRVTRGGSTHHIMSPRKTTARSLFIPNSNMV